MDQRQSFDILLITGTAGSGKTTTAEAWAASRSGLAAHLSHDDVHLFVKSGVVSPADGPSAEAERQWRIAIDVCVAASRIYVAAGIRCAIDTFLLPSTIPLWIGLQDFRVGVVVLRPDLDVAIHRNVTRLHASGWGVPEWQVRANHEAMGAWADRPDILMVDNSHLEVAQVIDLINEKERRERIPTLAWPTNNNRTSGVND